MHHPSGDVISPFWGTTILAAKAHPARKILNRFKQHHDEKIGKRKILFYRYLKQRFNVGAFNC